ncbi:calcium-binding protein [Pseudomonas sp. MS646]|uniref:calcium-binding protein n=1 Tax=Pseudomonas sp. MS646 TaxID=3118751 RepID=UPI0030D2C544
MPKLMVNVASRGTPLSDGGASQTGHLWFELVSDDGSALSFGFAPIEDGSPYGPGEVKRHDDEHYLGTEYSQQINITDYQYQTLLDFAQSPEAYNFSLQYSGINNSCIDFVWKALSLVDLNSEGYEGAIWPTSNIEALRAHLIMPWTQELNNKLILDMKRAFGTAEITRSPIILDLDGDGVETLGLSAGIHFDHDGNQFSEASGWVAPDDGLLVLDRNGNGTIDAGSELFGNNSMGANGNKAANGFLSLSALDENGDGVFDVRDSAFSQVRVWVDDNSDGVSQSGELYSLESVGVAAINTGYEEPGAVDANGDVSASVIDASGNQHRQVGTFLRTDGSIGIAEDVWFIADGADTIDLAETTIPSAISILPNLDGFGNVHNLHTAMALDASGELKSLLEQFVNANDSTTRQNLVIDILYHWAGVEDIDPESRAATQIYGNVIGDARKLAVLEAFLGENYLGTWCWGTRDPNPHGPAAAILLQSFDNLMAAVYGKLMLQTHFSSMFDGVEIELTETGSVWNVSSIISKLKVQFDNDHEAGAVSITEFGRSLSELGDFGRGLIERLQLAPATEDGLFDSLLKNIGKDSSFGGFGNDVLNGTGLDDSLYGFSGNDRIYGGLGDDLLSGGVGEDYLAGGDGADVYEFGRGDGKDTIFNADQDVSGSKIDKLLFGPSITAADIIVRRNYYDLILEIKGTSDSVTIQSYFDEDTVANHGYAVDRVVFDDGSFWTIDQIKMVVQRPTDGNDVIWGDASINTLKGGLGDDKLYGLANDDLLDGDEGKDLVNGGDGNDVLAGGEGDDSLYGSTGNDVLIGGFGNDFLEGGEGSDTYQFGKGWGQDTINNPQLGVAEFDAITFADGITSEDVILSQSGTDLVISLRGTTDRLTIKYYFEPSGGLSYRVQQVNFADGTVWTSDFISTMAQNGFEGDDLLPGTDAADSLVGGLGNDTLHGQGSNDSLRGDDGSDTLYGGGGDDIIHGGSGNDILDGGTGKNQLFGEAGEDVIQVAYNSTDNTLAGGTGNDTLTGSYFSDTYLFNLGDGQDTISEYDPGYSATDVLRFGEDILASDILMRRTGSDLVFMHRNGIDQVTLKAVFDRNTSDSSALASALIERIEFADGTTWTWSDMVAAGLSQTGTAGADNLVGFNGNDIIHGGSGNDTLDGGAGTNQLFGDAGDDVIQVAYNSRDNTLAGGTGNDTLTGGYFSDTYVFNLGDGQDTITEYDAGHSAMDTLRFGSGILASDIVMRRTGSDLMFLHRNGSDQVTVKGVFDRNGSDASAITSTLIERVEFADGTFWTWSDMVAAGLNQTGTAGADALVGFNGNDNIHAGAGNDTLDAGTGTNQLFGDAGDDVIQVAYNSRDNILAGGTGNDTLTGGYFSDTYLFNLGDGQDTISEYDAGFSGIDTLRFGAGILASDIQAYKSGADVVFMHNNGTDQVRIKGWFDGTTSSASVVTQSVLERIEFADGTVWSFSDISSISLGQVGTELGDVLAGGSGNDNIRGGDGDDIIDGGAGVNRLYGDAGDDSIQVASSSRDNILAGGTGKDTLKGGYFSDTYVFNLGDGQDTITEYDAGNSATDTLRFGSGILASDIVMRRVGSDLVLLHRNGSDQVTVKEVFDRDTSAASAVTSTLIERIEFADGTTWTWSDMVAAGLSQTGTAGADNLVGFNGNDIIHGGSGNDTLDGGAGTNQLFGDAGDDVIQVAYNSRDNTLAGGTGNDTLTGGYFSDTYVFNLGDGQDTITEYDAGHSAMDTLRFGSGILASDIVMRRTGSDLMFLHRNGSDQVTVKGVFDRNGSDASAITSTLIERVEFADGTFWTWSDMVAAGLNQTGTAGADALVGFNGNDNIHAGAGNDTLDAGTGTNQLFGDAGDDVIQVAYNSRDNILAGGTGNDTLTGGYFSDTYLFNLGDGQDTISEYDAGFSGIDTLRFGAGILASDIQAYKSGADVVFMHNNGTDQVRIKGWFDGTSSSAAAVTQSVLERVEFADGTSWSLADIATKGFRQVGTAGNDSLSGSSGNDSINGGDGDDLLDGGSGTNQLFGDAGNDVIQVAYNSRNNTLAGGSGNDVLTGGYFSDTYVFNLGDGQDTISEYDGGNVATDTLRFGSDIVASDIVIRRTGADLMFLHRNGSDQLMVKGVFDRNGSDASAVTSTLIERVEFADGTFWTWSDMVAAGLSQTGNAGADNLVGFNGNDIIHGGSGNDTLDGGAGTTQLFGDAGDDVIQVAYNSRDNTLAGGTGNDTLSGGYFSDTYLFNLGDGQDTISEYDPGYGGLDTLRFGSGVQASDILMRRTGFDLTFLHRNGTDQITVKGLFDGVTSNTSSVSQSVIERVEFADGTYWTWSDMVATGLNQTGTDNADTMLGWNGNDIIYGGSGDDTLDAAGGTNQLFGDAGNDLIQVATNSRDNLLVGGTGNDTLTGGYFSDTYVFNLGDGQDTISEYDPGYGGIDTLRFGTGILASDIQAYKSGADVVFMHSNGIDQVKVKGWFDGATSSASVVTQSVLERVEFADGTSWALADIAAKGLRQVGTAGADSLSGSNGNDNIYGGAGNDVLDGGAGTNRLFGEAGNDVIQVSSNSRDNTLSGGAGDDTLTGGYFADTYLFNRGDGQDTVNEYDPGYGMSDTLALGTDLSPQDLWFRRSGSDLEISVVGGDEKLTVSNWYQGGVYHIEAMKLSDGKTLLDSQVQSLVDTMASFGVAPGAEMTITTDQRAQLDSVLAANWK